MASMISLRIGQATLDPPDALFEEVPGKWIGVRLHILGQRDGDRPGFGRVGQHPHGFGQRGQELFRAGDAIEEPAHRAEAVIDAHVGGNRMLQLLKDRALVRVA